MKVRLRRSWALVFPTAGTAALYMCVQTAFAAPIVIDSMDDFQNIVSSGDYVLGQDIDATGFLYGSVGFFAGTFDGAGHTISNLSLSASSIYGNPILAAGLFGVNIGTIQNIGLLNVSVTGSPHIAGALAADNYGLIINSFSSGTITSLGAAGGLVGVNHGDNGALYGEKVGVITQSYSTVEVQGSYGGGLVGGNSGRITQSYALGDVTASAAGGIAGSNSFGTTQTSETGIIDQTFAAGSVNGTDVSGGLIGVYSSGAVSNSSWDTQATGQSTAVGQAITDPPGPGNNVAGLTTAQLKSGTLPAGFNPAVWNAVAGQYPTLKTGEPAPSLPPGAPQPNNPATLPGAVNLSVTSNSGVIDTSKPTIVLTHGWQPEGTFNDSETPLTGLHLAVQNALRNSDGTLQANVITFQWEGAFSSLPVGPRRATQDAGINLADQLVSMLGTNYNQNIHLVGHSFGSLVNAHAAAELDKKNAFDGNGVSVEQLTFLDAPVRGIANAVLLPSSTFYQVLPTGTVQYVDNFYGTTGSLLPDGLASFGSSLAGAAPNGGEAVPDLGHSDIQGLFYRNRVLDADGTWVTATIGDRYDARPAPETWTVPNAFVIAAQITTEFAADAWRPIVNIGKEVQEFTFTIAGQAYSLVVDAANLVISKSAEFVVASVNTVGNVTSALVDVGGGLINVVWDQVGSWLHLKESSPVMIARDVVIPKGTESLIFDLRVLNPGDGDWLTIHFNNDLLWSYRLRNIADDVLQGIVSLPEFAGHEGTLYLTLNSTGDRNAEILMGNLQFGSSATTSVPEPSTLALILTLLASLIGLQRLRHNQEPQVAVHS